MGYEVACVSFGELIMHQAQIKESIYTFIQNDVKIIDLIAAVPYDLKNYLDHSFISNTPQTDSR
jgi:hypothetical protein